MIYGNQNITKNLLIVVANVLEEVILMRCKQCNSEMEETQQLGSPISGWYCDKCKEDFDSRGDSQ